MGVMLICLQMRDSTQSPAVLPASAQHALCVGQPLEVHLKKHVQIWLHKTETGKAMQCRWISSLYIGQYVNLELSFKK